MTIFKAKRRRQSKSIYYIIIGIIMPVFLVFLISLIVIDIVAMKIDRKNNIGMIQQSMLQISDSIERHIDTTNHYLYMIYQNNSDYKALTRTLPEAQAYSHAADLNAVFGQYLAINKELDGYFLIYGKENSVIGRMDHEDIIPPHQAVIRQRVTGLMGGSMAFCEFIQEIENTHYYISLYQSGKIGIVFITGLDKYIRELEKQSSFAGKGFIFCPGFQANDAKDEMFHEYAQLEREKAYQGSIEMGAYTIIGQKVSDADFWMLYQVGNAELNRFSQVTSILFFMTIALVVSICVVVYFTLTKIVRPMYRMVDLMRQVKDAEMQEIADLHLPYCELEMMNTTLIDMVNELRQQKENFYEEKLSRQTAELQFMQAQLKPHFYLNCLKALNAKAYDAGMQDMQDMILLISDYLRNCLGSVKSEVLLMEELQMTETYVELQKKISGRRIEYSCSVEKGLENQKVPAFCVQSFVENSIKYAQNKLNRDLLKVQVIIRKLVVEQEEKLDIVVMDSGQGYKESMLEEYNRKYYYDSVGVGINNIKRRCDILYGDNAVYLFYNMDGAVSELMLPMNANAFMDVRNTAGNTELHWEKRMSIDEYTDC